MGWRVQSERRKMGWRF